MYAYRHMHLCMYTQTSICIPPHSKLAVYTFNQTLATVPPARCQAGVNSTINSQCTIPVLYCSVFPKFYVPYHREQLLQSLFPKHISPASLILQKLLANGQRVCSAPCSQLLSDELHVCFRSVKFLENSYTFLFERFPPWSVLGASTLMKNACTLFFYMYIQIYLFSTEFLLMLATESQHRSRWKPNWILFLTKQH